MRKTNHEINELFVKRWSPRAIGGEVKKEDLMSILEAARWAPSSFNEQPWRFTYGRKGTDTWNMIFDSLVEFNQSWAKHSPVFIVISAKKFFSKNNKENLHFAFDSGAAWQNLALQARELGYYTHAMAGFDKEKLSIEDEPLAVIALGEKVSEEQLPEDLRSEEPSDRIDTDKLIQGEW